MESVRHGMFSKRKNEIVLRAKEVYETPIRFTLRKHNLSKTPLESCFRLQEYNANFSTLFYRDVHIVCSRRVVRMNKEETRLCVRHIIILSHWPRVVLYNTTQRVYT